MKYLALFFFVVAHFASGQKITAGDNVEKAQEISVGKYVAEIAPQQKGYYQFTISQDGSDAKLQIGFAKESPLQAKLLVLLQNSLIEVGKQRALETGVVILAKALKQGRYYIEVNNARDSTCEYALRLDTRFIAKKYTFRFQPQDRLVCMQNYKKISEGKSLDLTIGKTQQIFRKQDNGYILERTLISAETKQNGQKVQDLRSQLLQGVAIYYHLDVDGRMNRVSGYEPVLEKIKKNFPNQDTKILQEALAQQEKEKWNFYIGSWIGKKVELGKPVLDQTEVQIPSWGKIPIYTATKPIRVIQHKGRTCLQLLYIYNSDSEALKKTVPDLPIPQNQNNSRLNISGQGERIIEPDTMLIHFETNIRLITIHTKNKKIRITEKEEYTFEYK